MHDWSNRRYVIAPLPQPPEVYLAVLGTESTCRRSLDNTKVVLKWDGGPTPPPLADLEILDHASIIELLSGPEWTDTEDSPDADEE